jgi:hypothetical protein
LLDHPGAKEIQSATAVLPAEVGVQLFDMRRSFLGTKGGREKEREDKEEERVPMERRRRDWLPLPSQGRGLGG